MPQTGRHDRNQGPPYCWGMRGDEKRVVDAYAGWLEGDGWMSGARWTFLTSTPSVGRSGCMPRPRAGRQKSVWTLTFFTGSFSDG